MINAPAGTASPTSGRPRVRGLHAITLSEKQLDPSAGMLTDLLGMNVAGQEGERTRFGMAESGSGALVDVYAGVRDRGLQAGGTVHHVAFRAPDLATMTLWQQELIERASFTRSSIAVLQSIYFPEPAAAVRDRTDAPVRDRRAFAISAAPKLPPWLEPSRSISRRHFRRCSSTWTFREW